MTQAWVLISKICNKFYKWGLKQYNQGHEFGVAFMRLMHHLIPALTLPFCTAWSHFPPLTPFQPSVSYMRTASCLGGRFDLGTDWIKQLGHGVRIGLGLILLPLAVPISYLIGFCIGFTLGFNKHIDLGMADTFELSKNQGNANRLIYLGMWAFWALVILYSGGYALYTALLLLGTAGINAFQDLGKVAHLKDSKLNIERFIYVGLWALSACVLPFLNVYGMAALLFTISTIVTFTCPEQPGTTAEWDPVSTPQNELPSSAPSAMLHMSRAQSAPIFVCTETHNGSVSTRSPRSSSTGSYPCDTGKSSPSSIDHHQRMST